MHVHRKHHLVSVAVLAIMAFAPMARGANDDSPKPQKKSWLCEGTQITPMPAARIDKVSFSLVRTFYTSKDSNDVWRVDVNWSAEVDGAFEGFEGKLAGAAHGGSWQFLNDQLEQKFIKDLTDTRPFVTRSYRVSGWFSSDQFGISTDHLLTSDYHVDELTGQPRTKYVLDMVTGDEDLSRLKIVGLSDKEYPDSLRADIFVHADERYKKIGKAAFTCKH